MRLWKIIKKVTLIEFFKELFKPMPYYPLTAGEEIERARRQKVDEEWMLAAVCACVCC